jgi:hypothetical protein
MRHADGSMSVMTLAFEGHRVKSIYMVRNPEKHAGIRQ